MTAVPRAKGMFYIKKIIFITSIVTIIFSMSVAEAYDRESCPDGFVLVKKTNTGKHSCFFEEHAQIIENREWGFVVTSDKESKLIFTMIIMPPDKIDYIHENWMDGDMVTSERIQALNLFPEKTKALVITTEDNLEQAILQANQYGIEYVVYNNEPNNGPSSTPPEEIEDAPNAIKRVADRVHAEGLKFVSAPSFGLMIKIVDDVDWKAVNPEIAAFQLQRSTSTQQIIDEFNEKAEIIRNQNIDTIFMLQINPEWQTISDVKHVLMSTKEVGGISIVCNFDSCTEEYLDEIFKMR
jgi:hypothetical protein